MILKNIFGKTIEAAKKTALQMYGEDFLVLESSEGNGADKEASITIFQDSDTKQSTTEKQNNQQQEGVHFERSTERVGSHIDSLRKYAAEQLLLQHDPSPATMAARTANKNGKVVPDTTEKSTATYTRRVVARPLRKKISQKNDGAATTENSSGGNGVLTRPTSATKSRDQQRELTALHKRFDKMEALLDSALISANLDYASHPAFQQLIQTGISTSTVARWFSEIVKNGTDPFVDNGRFMQKLGAMVRKAVGEATTDEASRYMMFSGPSASGKTSLIMKLCTHHQILSDKSVCVINIEPKTSPTNRYYTVLEPFCRDMEIPYYSVSGGKEISELMDTLESYDHVLIDTPSLPTASEDGFRSFWKLRQMLSPLTPFEIHYVVNAASSKLFLDRSASVHHPLQPDYIDITHLDEVEHWGSVIPFLSAMGCKARYLSTGNTPSTLSEFDPQWFVQKVIQDS